MPAAELVNKFSVVRWSIVGEEQDATPLSQSEFEKPDEFALPFSLCEHIRKPLFGSRPKHIDADVLVIDWY